MLENAPTFDQSLLELRFDVVVLQELIGRKHRDAVPRADLMAERAADATREVDRADLKRLLVTRTGDGADAIDRTDAETGFAAGAHVFVEQRQNFWELFLGHAVSL